MSHLINMIVVLHTLSDQLIDDSLNSGTGAYLANLKLGTTNREYWIICRYNLTFPSGTDNGISNIYFDFKWWFNNKKRRNYQ